jgi:hypothetical protein
VEETEPKGAVTKDASHRSAEDGSDGLLPGTVRIKAQSSELVPVAQYASVTLGPVQYEWILTGVDMEALIDIDWDDLDSMTPKQQAVYDRVRGAQRATSKVIEHGIAEDRELVEQSIRLHNEREEREREEAEKSKQKTQQKRSRR